MFLSGSSKNKLVKLLTFYVLFEWFCDVSTTILPCVRCPSRDFLFCLPLSLPIRSIDSNFRSLISIWTSRRKKSFICVAYEWAQPGFQALIPAAKADLLSWPRVAIFSPLLKKIKSFFVCWCLLSFLIIWTEKCYIKEEIFLRASIVWPMPFSRQSSSEVYGRPDSGLVWLP